MCCHLLAEHWLCASEMQIPRSLLQPDPNIVSCCSARAGVLQSSQQRLAVVLGTNAAFAPEHHIQIRERSLFQNIHCQSAIRYCSQQMCAG